MPQRVLHGHDLINTMLYASVDELQCLHMSLIHLSIHIFLALFSQEALAVRHLLL